jgi:hypothetical protein
MAMVENILVLKACSGKTNLARWEGFLPAVFPSSNVERIRRHHGNRREDIGDTTYHAAIITIQTKHSK